MPSNRKSLLIVVISSAGILILCGFFYFLLQNRFVYDHVAGYVIKNYHYENNNIVKGKIPFESYDESKMLHWDAELYYKIKENGYDLQSAGGEYIFAFFPLFPLIWSITHMTPTLLIFFNYMLFLASIILIVRYFNIQDDEKRNLYVVLSICSPMLVVFLIPYSEGIFMITTTVALWGIYRNKYLVYFTAALLMSMTRSSVTIIIAALLVTEIYFLLGHRSIVYFLRAFGWKVLPIIIGVFVVSIIQRSYGSDSIFKFLEAQKYWGFQFQIPNHLTDWAHEQFGTNMSLLLLVLPLSCIYLTFQGFKKIRNNREDPEVKTSSFKDYKREYLFVFSLLYMSGIILSILFFRGGSLNGISRYILCTPFYYVMLFQLKDKLSGFKAIKKALVFILLLSTTAAALTFLEYANSWNFDDTGFVLFFMQLAFFVFADLPYNKWLVASYIVVTAIWTSYLFNMFISNAWIFT